MEFCALCHGLGTYGALRGRTLSTIMGEVTLRGFLVGVLPLKQATVKSRNAVYVGFAEILPALVLPPTDGPFWKFYYILPVKHTVIYQVFQAGGLGGYSGTGATR